MVPVGATVVCAALRMPVQLDSETIRAARPPRPWGRCTTESFVDDLEVFYEQELIRKVTALVRDVKPSIILTQSIEDYMEDHMNTARVTVTAAFCRGMLNYWSIPERPIHGGDVTLYHATPHVLTDGMRRPIVPEVFVDVGSVLERKRSMLACHKSQKEWLGPQPGLRLLPRDDGRHLPGGRKDVGAVHLRRGLAAACPHRLLRQGRKPPRRRAVQPRVRPIGACAPVLPAAHDVARPAGGVVQPPAGLAGVLVPDPPPVDLILSLSRGSRPVRHPCPKSPIRSSCFHSRRTSPSGRPANRR